MTITLLHSADLHLDAPLRAMALADPALLALVQSASRQSLERLVEHAVKHQVAALLLAGDVFDSAVQSMHTAAFFVGRMQALHDAGVPAYMIRGNHDAANDAPWRLSLPPNVHEFSSDGGCHRVPGLGEGVSIRVHGVSFSERHAPVSLLPAFGPPQDDGVDIGLLHTSLSGATGHDPYAPCTVSDLVNHGFAYWALGHVHSRTIHSEGPSWVVMPGTPQGRHINETGQKSATAIDIRDSAISAVRSIPTAAVVFEHVSLPCDGFEISTLAQRCRHVVEKRAENILSAGQAMIVRIYLEGTPAALRPLRLNGALHHEIVAEQLRASGPYWLEGLRFAPVAVPGPQGSTIQGVTAEIVQSMTNLAAQPALRQQTRAILDAHLAPLDPTTRARLVPDDAAMLRLLDKLAAEGSEEIAAALEAGTGEDE